MRHLGPEICHALEFSSVQLIAIDGKMVNFEHLAVNTFTVVLETVCSHVFVLLLNVLLPVSDDERVSSTQRPKNVTGWANVVFVVGL